MAGNFEANMRNDLGRKLDAGGSNEVLHAEISELMSYKYPSLETFCLVYNDLQGFDKHCFNGHRVESLHRNGKCGIVFYRTKGQAQMSNRLGEAYKIVAEVGGSNADEVHKNIEAKLGQRGIGWTGCAVIKSYADLKYGGTFSTKTVDVVGQNFTIILLLQ